MHLLGAPSPNEVLTIYYLSKAVLIVLGIGIIIYACLRKRK